VASERANVARVIPRAKNGDGPVVHFRE
jgi:hypothetical protein